MKLNLRTFVTDLLILIVFAICTAIVAYGLILLTPTFHKEVPVEKAFFIPGIPPIFEVSRNFEVVWWFFMNAGIQLWGSVGFLLKPRELRFRSVIWLSFSLLLANNKGLILGNLAHFITVSFIII